MTKGKHFLLAFCYSGCYNSPALMRLEALPLTADGCPSFARREVIRMVTYEGLFAFIVAICAIISLFQNNQRKRK